MEIGMSLACFYPMEPEKAICEAAALNINVCEVFLNTVSELDEEYLHMIRDECDRFGIRIYSIHPFTSFLENYLFFSAYPRRIADSVIFYRRYAEAAKILGAEVINIHGDRGIGLENLDDYVDYITPLMKLQDETGIIYSMENVFFNSVNYPDFTAKLRQKVPNVRFTFDVKQAYKGNQDPYALAEAMGSSIVNFHVNDRNADHVCLLPGKGTVDFGRIGRILSNNNYKGPGLIEVYSQNFKDRNEIADAKSFLEEKFLLQNDRI
ncbi:MAG: sugar phosphate isomerase/epimerase [Clostridia bacterium]|nr:sugar phosphate isomerase/epimerase [Clostridia bacterium]